MVYLLGWGCLFSFTFIQCLSRYRGTFFVFTILIFFTVTAFVRGSVGTDTVNYELMLRDFFAGYTWDGREPGFVALGWLLVAATPSVEVAVRTIALVFFGLLAFFVLRSDRNERFLLMAYIFPAFAYQYSMNALRIGIASAILLIAVQMLRRMGKLPAFLAGSTAVLFHYSAALSLIFIILSQRPLFRASNIALAPLALVSAFGSFAFVDSYMMDKLSNYNEMQAPGELSGLSKIAPIALVLLGLIFSTLPRTLKIRLFLLGTASVLVGWVLAQYSYAGLRVLDLLSFALPISILASYSRESLAFDRSMMVGVLAAGVISAAGLWRGFSLAEGEGDSPFLPYVILNSWIL